MDSWAILQVVKTESWWWAAKEAIHIIYHIARRVWADAELGIVCITINELL